MKCKSCGKELCQGDYGYYCDNQDCELFDINIEDYEAKYCPLSFSAYPGDLLKCRKEKCAFWVSVRQQGYQADKCSVALIGEYMFRQYH